MPSQDKHIICGPPVLDKGGHEETDTIPTMEMEWSSDPNCGDLDLKEGEEEGKVPVEASLKLLDTL